MASGQMNNGSCVPWLIFFTPEAITQTSLTFLALLSCVQHLSLTHKMRTFWNESLMVFFVRSSNGEMIVYEKKTAQKTPAEMSRPKGKTFVICTLQLNKWAVRILSFNQTFQWADYQYSWCLTYQKGNFFRFFFFLQTLLYAAFRSSREVVIKRWFWSE